MLLVGCAPRVVVPPTFTPASAGVAPVLARSGGGLPTRPVVHSPTPTATTDLQLLLVTVVPIPTRTPGPPPTATATLIPPYTSTPRPPPTPPSASGPRLVVTPPPVRPPTRTPAPRGTFTGPGVELVPTETPVDSNEPNDTPARATELDALPLEAYANGPQDVDVYRVAVTEAEADLLLVVTLSGGEANRYKVDIVAPKGGKVGRRRPDGTTAIRVSADVRGDVGTYYVHVQGVGNPVPGGPYFISAEFTVAIPTATPTRAR